MRSNVVALNMSSTAMTGTTTITSAPILIDQTYGVAIQVAFTGTPTGTFTVQGSCDPVPAHSNVSNGGPYTVTNWSNTSNTIAAAGAAGNGLININGAFYNFIRIIYTNTSGTGSLTVANACIKGV